jgi:lipopolysaccharide transport system permease protein
LIWVPFGVLVLIALGVGLGLLIMPVAILYHDVGQGLPFVLYLWMFLTPVLYPAPETWPASSLVTFNPVTALLDTTRAWMISTSPEHFGAFLVVTALTTAMLLAGWLVYRLALPILIERMSA